MPKVTDEHRAAQRERIHAATIAVVERKGLAGLTMGDIIAESGLSAGAIYVYYPGKAELLRAVAQSVLDPRVDVLTTVIQQRPTPPLDEVLRALLPRVPAKLVFQVWAGAAGDPSLMVVARDMLDQVGAVIDGYLCRVLTDRGVNEAEASAAATRARPAVLGLIQGYIVQSELTPPAPVDAYVAAIDVCFSGILASATS